MPVFFYILKLSVCLIIVWLFYQLVLRRLTFYTWNRWYLMVCTVLAFLLPLINIAPVLDKNNWTKTPLVSAIPQLPGYTTTYVIPKPTFSEQLLSWLPYIIAIGAMAMLTRLLIQYFSLLAMRRSSQLLLNGPVKVYQVNKAVIPFSFGNAIYLNQHLHEEEELKEIIRHEFIHVKQRHTIDIIWSEAMCILTWYNPFSWLLRKAIRQNLEFIADQQVLKTGLDRKQYQYLLLKVIGVPTYSIASNFNFKSLKKRIAMMNKVKSARLHLVRFLLLLPVVAIILVAFRNAAKHRQLPPADIAVRDTTGPTKKFPENVRSFHTVNNRVTVTLKNGREETYNLDNSEELAAFEKKYGKMPEPPTPPIPPADLFEIPAAPLADASPHTFPVPDPAPHAPVAPLLPTEHMWYDLVHPDHDDYNDKGYSLTIVQTRKGPMVIVLHKSRREAELVYLEDWNKDKKYEQKYGKLSTHLLLQPSAPFPPPTPIGQMPDGIAEVHVKDFDAVVKTVDGTVDRYNLRIAADKTAYESKVTPHAFSPVMADAIKVGKAPVYSEDHLVQDVPVVREIEVLGVIKSTMSDEEIEKLKTELKTKGFDLNLLNVQRDNNKIVSLQGRLNTNTHKSSFTGQDFESIIFSREHKTRGLARIEIIVKKNKEEQ